ncbi:MAG: ATP-binding cassette domain-containing protein, partial [Alphaproteobacteria bacterium]
MTLRRTYDDFKLAAEGLQIARGNRVLVHGLDFTLANGGALALSGPNGSGKSTLLRVLAGLTPPAAGAIYYNDRPAHGDTADELRRNSAYFGHRTALKPMLSVADNLAFWAHIRG